MALKSSLSFAVLSCALAGFPPRAAGQFTGAIKAPSPAGPSYAKEEIRNPPTELARKEADLRAAIAAHPDSASLVYALALVLRQEDRPGESLQVYTQAAQLRRPTPQELRSVALDYVLLNDYDDAIRWLETAAGMDDTDPDTFYALGRCYYTKNRFGDAEKMYNHVLTLHPKYLKAEENLGLVYDATNRAPEAETALRTAAGWADPQGNDPWPFIDLGGFLLDHGRANDSLEPLQTAIKIQPNSAPAHEKLGRALLNTQQLNAGIEQLQKAAALAPRDPKVHYELGRALRQTGKNEEAKKEFALSQKLYATHSEE